MAQSDQTQNVRLDRIEEKIDKLADALVAIARTEERLIAMESKNTAQYDRMNNFSKKLDAVESLLVRMDDKIMRIKNKGINDETEDTVTDLIGYLFLLKMAMERKN